MSDDLKNITLELYSKTYFTGEEIISNKYESTNQDYFKLILGGTRQKFTYTIVRWLKLNQLERIYPN